MDSSCPAAFGNEHAVRCLNYRFLNHLERAVKFRAGEDATAHRESAPYIQAYAAKDLPRMMMQFHIHV
jgi:hypothetical protein